MSKCLRFLFILFLGTLYAQDSTPIVSFELTRDNYYENQIKKLKESINKNNELELFDSISNFAFQYKDWETSIEYLEKLIKTNPTSMRYFLLGGAAGFRALEVSVFSSLKYINIMKPAFEKALELEPNNSLFMRAQVDVLISLPSILGGNIEKAKEIAKQIKLINPLEGLLAEGFIYEKLKNYKSAKLTYSIFFDLLKQNKEICSKSFLNYLKNNRRDLAYDLGKIAAEYSLGIKWGQCALSDFLNTYKLSDTVPLAWVYYQIARLSKIEGNEIKMKENIDKALSFKADYPILENLLNKLL